MDDGGQMTLHASGMGRVVPGPPWVLVLDLDVALVPVCPGGPLPHTLDNSHNYSTQPKYFWPIWFIR